MRKLRTWLLLFSLLIPLRADAQNFFTWAPDTLGVLNQTVSVPVNLLTETTEGHAFVLSCDCDPTKLTPLSITYGPGLDDQVNSNGEPPICDVVVFPSVIDLYLELQGNYTSGEFGYQFLYVNFAVVGGADTITDINYTLDVATAGGTIGGDPSLWTELSSTAVVHIATTLPTSEPFLRGDANGDGVVDIGDPIRILGMLFSTDGPLICSDAGDMNDDGNLNIADPVGMLSQLFSMGEFSLGACTFDPTLDSLVPCSVPTCTAP